MLRNKLDLSIFVGHHLKIQFIISLSVDFIVCPLYQKLVASKILMIALEIWLVFRI